MVTFRLPIIVLLLFMSPFLMAQSTYLSEYALLYRVQKEEVLKYYINENSEELLEAVTSRVPIDTLNSSGQGVELPAQKGAYLVLWVNDFLVNWKFLFQTDLKVDLQTSGLKIKVYVYENHSYQAVSSATVQKGKQYANYSKEEQAYLFGYLKTKKHSKPESFLIQSGEDIIITTTDEKNPRYGYGQSRYYFQRRWYRFTRKLEEKIRPYRTVYGYIALNKPEYRVGDTVHFKALGLNSKGKAQEGLGLKMSYYDGLKRKKLSVSVNNLEHYAPGRFKGFFVISDSLEGLRLNFELTTSDYNKYLLIHRSINVKDYRFDEVDFDYEILNNENELYADQPLVFKFSAFDDNGLPVLDGKVHIKINASLIDRDTLVDHITLPEVVLDTTISLDPDGISLFKYHGTKLPPAKVKLSGKMVFTNSENERHQKNFIADYYSTKFPYKIEEDRQGFTITFDDTLKNHLINEIQIKAYESHSNRFTQSFKRLEGVFLDTLISIPYFQEWLPIVSHYEIYYQGRLASTIFPSNEHVGVQFGTLRDSVFILRPGATKDRYRYEIFANGRKSIGKGVFTEDTVFLAFPKAKYLIFSYAKLGSDWSINSVIPLSNIYKSKLEMFVPYLSGPTRIRPGDKTYWKLSVKDKKERPVKDFDIVGLSVKKSFDQPNIGLIIPNNKLRHKLKYPSQAYLSYNSSESEKLAILNQGVYDDLGLIKQNLYKYLMYDEALVVDTFSIGEESALGQLAAFTYEGKLQQAVYYIRANGKLIYAYNLENKSYSFFLKPGVYDLEIRGVDFLIDIDSVNIYAGKKTEIAIHLDQLSENVKVHRRKAYFSKEEWEMVNKNAFILLDGFTSFYFERGQNFINSNSRDNNSFGPFTEGGAKFWRPGIDTIDFYFKPGRVYQFSHKTVEITQPYKQYSRRSLPLRLENQIPGGVLSAKQPSKLQTSSRLQNPIPYFFNNLIAGQLNIRNNTDSTFFRYQFYNYEESKVYSIKVNFTSNQTWPSGTYRLQAFTKKLNSIVVDSIKLKEGTVTNVWFDPGRFNPQVSKLEMDSLMTLKGVDNPSGLNNLIGLVVDQVDQLGLPFANVILKNKNGRIVDGSTTDIDGKFHFSGISNGLYSIEISMLGFTSKKIKTVKISHGKSHYFRIGLERSSESLEEVHVSYSPSGYQKQVTDIQPLAVRSINGVAALTSGVNSESRPSVRVLQANGSTGFVSKDIARNKYDMDEPTSSMSIKRSLEQLGPSEGRVRDNFKDYAFFIPDLKTDEKGEVNISTNFPDDVNAWSTVFLGFGEGFKYFQVAQETKSFSEIITRLAVPPYLRSGDSCIAFGKALNYLDTNLSVRTFFEVNGDLQLDTFRTLQSSLLDPLSIKADHDSLKLKYSIFLNNGYTDGEIRKIPVYKTGLTFNEGQFVKIKKDTLVHIYNPDTNRYTISVMQGRGDILKALTRQLIAYPYECNEQLSSKLMAFMIEWEMAEIEGRIFKQEVETRRIIKKIMEATNKAGGWGWWSNQSTDVFMTSYVLNALAKAKSNGFSVTFTPKTTNHIDDLLFSLKPQNVLEILYATKGLKQSKDLAFFLKKIHPDSLTQSQIIKWGILATIAGVNYDEGRLEALIKADMLRNKYVQTEDTYSLRGSLYNTALMAEWLVLNGRKDDVQLMQDHLLLKDNLGYLNTIEKAAAIQLLRYFYDGDRQTDLSVSLNNESMYLSNDKFNLFYSNSDSIRLDLKTDEPIYISYSVKQFDVDPERFDKYFEINQSWYMDRKEVDTVNAGKVATMKIDISSARKADYVMIQIPKPAGAEYINGGFSHGRHIVEKQQYINLYFNSLPQGKTSVELKFNPRFRGAFKLDPVKVEMMYFPVFYGNNQTGRLNVN